MGIESLHKSLEPGAPPYLYTARDGGWHQQIEKKLSLFALRRPIRLSSTPHGLAPLSNQPLRVTARGGFASAHGLRTDSRLCFRAPFIIEFCVCSLGMAPPPQVSGYERAVGQGFSVLQPGHGDQPSDVSAANIAAGDRVQKTWRERVPFCDGGSNARQGVRQAILLQETIRHIRRADQEPSLPD